MSHDIFVSYSSKDKAVADAIVSALENSGLRCWVAPRDVKPGTDWGDSITEAISGCKTLILIFSSHSNQSKHVKDELYYAIAEEKIILPFRIENLDPTGAMRLHLASRHWLDAFQPSWKAHINRLIESAADSIGRGPAAAATENVPSGPDLAALPGKRKRGSRSWLGLAVLAAAVLGVAGFLWWNSRAGGEKPQIPTQPGETSILTPTSIPATPARPTPTATARTHSVSSTADSGFGTLRQAILDVKPGDTITFDTRVFPPGRPATIFVTSELPRISYGNIKIDASNAGVILDGSQIQGESIFGLIINSDFNTIRGLQIINFSSVAVYLEGGSFNKIGGDRNIGTGPLGQGNLMGNSYIGISILPDAGGNTITGNLIGTDLSGSEPNGNWKVGIWLENNPDHHQIHNTIGPGNIIAFNGERASADGDVTTGGICLDTDRPGATITQNAIHDNAGPGIFYNITDLAPAVHPDPPAILFFDLDAGTVSGHSCKDCVVEIFSTETQDGKIYEGTVTADAFGNFTFYKALALSGPFLTATTHSTGHNTSAFSLASPARSAIQIALDAIRDKAPVYQNSFDTLNSIIDPMEKARIEDGKLILASQNENVGVGIKDHPYDRFAVEFELRILESGPDDTCYFGVANDSDNEESRRELIAGFRSNGQAFMEHYVHPESHWSIAESRYDDLNPNTVTLIYLGDQIAALINKQLAYTTLDPDGSAVYASHAFSANKTITCEIDNYMLWDLRGVDFNP